MSDDSLPPGVLEATIKAVTAKRDQLVAERAQLFEQREEILARLRRIERELTDCRAAVRFFQLDIDVPLTEREEYERQMVARREEMRRYEVERTQRSALAHDPGSHRDLRPALNQAVTRAIEGTMAATLPSLSGAAAGVVASPPPTEEKPPAARPPVREFLLARMQAVYPEGRKAAVLRDEYETAHGVVIHEKTVGMTLYRLSKEKDGPIRREGHLWFFVPDKAGMKNPGGETPGPTSSAN